MSSIIALHLACEAGAGDCIGTLVGQGADHSLLDKAGRAPLKIVCDAGFADCIGPVSVTTAFNASIGSEVLQVFCYV